MVKCNSDCELCHGDGWVETAGGYTQCPNTPLDFRSTGVVESDRDVPKLLPPTKVLSIIGGALKNLRATGYGMLWLQGDYGVGKTVMARAATVEAYTQFGSALYKRHMDMINNLRAVSLEREVGPTKLIRLMAEINIVRWLVVDEIGRLNRTDYSDQLMGEIVDTRYQMALSKTAMTVLISNNPPEDTLPAFLVDRIRDTKNRFLVVEGKSLRKG